MALIFNRKAQILLSAFFLVAKLTTAGYGPARPSGGLPFYAGLLLGLMMFWI
jgi:hypothetical protein